MTPPASVRNPLALWLATANEVRRRGLDVRHPGGLLQPRQGFLVQFIAGAQTKGQQLLLRHLQQTAVCQEYQHPPPLMLGGFYAVNPHR